MNVESLMGRILGSYESGSISRRQFIESVSMLVAMGAAPSAIASVSETAETARPLEPITPVSVNHIAIGVSDIKRSKDWYTQLLKLKTIQENENYALLQFANTQLVLRSRTEQHPKAQPGTISHVMFGLSPYNEPALKARLEAAGLNPHKDLESFLVRGPDNLLVQIGDERMGIDKGYPPSAQ